MNTMHVLATATLLVCVSYQPTVAHLRRFMGGDHSFGVFPTGPGMMMPPSPFMPNNGGVWSGGMLGGPMMPFGPDMNNQVMWGSQSPWMSQSTWTDRNGLSQNMNINSGAFNPSDPWFAYRQFSTGGAGTFDQTGFTGATGVGVNGLVPTTNSLGIQTGINGQPGLQGINLPGFTGQNANTWNSLSNTDPNVLNNGFLGNNGLPINGGGLTQNPGGFNTLNGQTNGFSEGFNTFNGQPNFNNNGFVNPSFTGKKK